MPSVEVSVIIAAYNAQGSIGQAIASAQAQDVGLEIIVVDDASSDGTADAVDAIADPRIRFTRLSQNMGPGGARNVALSAATGTYAAVLDADDAYEGDRLARMMSAAKRRSADAVIDNVRIEHKTAGTALMLTPAQIAALSDRVDLAGFIRGNHPMVKRYTLGQSKPLFRMNTLRAHGLCYRPELRIGEDYMLMADLLAAGGLCVLEPTAGYRYRRGHSSISHRLTLEHISAMQRADAAFAACHRLSPEALAALKEREAVLRDLSAFTASIDALKQSRPLRAFAALAARPKAIVQYRYPVAARLSRLLGSPPPAGSTAPS